MEPCKLCEGVHESVNCDDRDMTVIGICRICAGVMRECYRHKTTGDFHTACIGTEPVSLECYDRAVKFLAENFEYCNKLIPIPEHIVSPEEFEGELAN